MCARARMAKNCGQGQQLAQIEAPADLPAMAKWSHEPLPTSLNAKLTRCRCSETRGGISLVSMNEGFCKRMYQRARRIHGDTKRNRLNIYLA